MTTKKDSEKGIPPDWVESQEMPKDLSNPLDFLSQAESKTSDFMPLAEDIYKLEVITAKIVQRQAYQSTEMRDYIQLELWVEQLDPGKPIKDVKGNTQNPGVRKLWESLDLMSRGFKPDGTPSKTRACLCALLKADPIKSFKLGSLNELIGKECKAMVGLAIKQDGSQKNKVIKYMQL